MWACFPHLLAFANGRRTKVRGETDAKSLPSPAVSAQRVSPSPSHRDMSLEQRSPHPPCWLFVSASFRFAVQRALPPHIIGGDLSPSRSALLLRLASRVVGCQRRSHFPTLFPLMSTVRVSVSVNDPPVAVFVFPRPPTQQPRSSPCSPSLIAVVQVPPQPLPG